MLAHAGRPHFTGALDLMARYWARRLVDLADRVGLCSDVPHIPYPYAEQITAIEWWAARRMIGSGRAPCWQSRTTCRPDCWR